MKHSVLSLPLHYKNMKTKIVALILAGGHGSRMDSTCPKQYIEVHGESILHHTCKAFDGLVDDVLVVCQDEWRHKVEPYPCCQGGTTGYDSLCRGVEALASYPDGTIVMVHDAVRPLISRESIIENIRIAREYGNAITAVGTYETLLQVPDDCTVRSTIRREGIFRAQTPQTFTLGTLRTMLQEANARCINDAQSVCTLASQLGYELHIAKGNLSNFKITTPDDLTLYERLLS